MPEGCLILERVSDNTKINTINSPLGLGIAQARGEGRRRISHSFSGITDVGESYILLRTLPMTEKATTFKIEGRVKTRRF